MLVKKKFRARNEKLILQALTLTGTLGSLRDFKIFDARKRIASPRVVSLYSLLLPMFTFFGSFQSPELKHYCDVVCRVNI